MSFQKPVAAVQGLSGWPAEKGAVAAVPGEPLRARPAAQVSRSQGAGAAAPARGLSGARRRGGVAKRAMLMSRAGMAVAVLVRLPVGI